MEPKSKKGSQDRKLLALTQRHEVATVATKFCMKQKDVRAFVEKMKADNKHPRSQDDVEKELILAGYNKTPRKPKKAKTDDGDPS